MTRYQRWSLRLSNVTLAQITQLALAEGWQLSDFMRTLVVLGAAANWLGLQSEENLQLLKMKTELRDISKRLGKFAPAARQTRPYAPRRAQDTDVVGLILPTELARLIESYAKIRPLSKNDLCGILLMDGLMIYLSGEKNLMQAIVPADRSPKENSVTQG